MLNFLIKRLLTGFGVLLFFTMNVQAGIYQYSYTGGWDDGSHTLIDVMDPWTLEFELDLGDGPFADGRLNNYKNSNVTGFQLISGEFDTGVLTGADLSSFRISTDNFGSVVYFQFATYFPTLRSDVKIDTMHYFVIWDIDEGTRVSVHPRLSVMLPSGTWRDCELVTCERMGDRPQDVPEPASIALLALGLVGLFVSRRKGLTRVALR